MLPVRDANPTSRPTFVTLVVIAACIVVYFFVQPAGNAFDEARFTFRHAAVPDEVVTQEPLTTLEVAQTLASAPAAVAMCGTDQPEQPCFPTKSVPLSLLVSIFLHGGLAHLLGNLLFLWIFGNNVEDRLGAFGFVLFYAVTGVVATLAHVAVDPSSTVPLIGASGAIAGVMGAYLVWFPRARVTTLFFVLLIVPVRIQARWLLLGWLVMQFFTDPNSGVAWVAHVAGFVFGVLVGLLLRSRVAPPVDPYGYPPPAPLR
jgi:membrane associated rhomboid family serine protease